MLASVREYFPAFQETEAIEDLDAALDSDRAWLLDLVSKHISSESVEVFLRGEYDFDNLYYIWKRIWGEKGEGPIGEGRILASGIVPAEVISKAFENGSSLFLPEYLKGTFEKLSNTDGSSDFADGREACESDKWRCAMDRAPDGWARSYTRWRIDLQNIRNFIRMKRTGLHGGEGVIRFIEGGTIDTITLDQLFSGSGDELYSYLKTNIYSWMVERGLDAQTPLWKIDTLSAGQIFSLVAESRFGSFGIAPLIYHIEFRKKLETLLRAAIVCGLNNMPDETVAEILDALLMVSERGK